jgi:hypothetical protein
MGRWLAAFFSGFTTVIKTAPIDTTPLKHPTNLYLTFKELNTGFYFLHLQQIFIKSSFLNSSSKDWFATIRFKRSFSDCNCLTSGSIKIGRQLNDAQNKDDAKRELLLMLFSLRCSPLHYDFVRSLNQIDVVFEDTPSVLDAWHTHYDSLQIKGQANELQIWELQRTNLLSAMAVSLNYKSIRQTDMLKNYYPEGHEKQNISNWKFRYERQEFYKAAKDLNKLLFDYYSSGGLPPSPPKEK